MQINQEGFLSNPKILRLVNKGPLIGTDNDQIFIQVFRKILECSLTQGRWSGKTAEVS
jgi:hypothetical protein